MSELGNKETMAKNIQYYMDLFGKTRSEMCSALGVKYTTFTDWVKGNTYPRIDKIELMANYFGIEKSDLVERRSRSTEQNTFPLTDHETIAIKKYRTLDEHGKKNVDTILDNEYERCNVDIPNPIILHDIKSEPDVPRGFRAIPTPDVVTRAAHVSSGDPQPTEEQLQKLTSLADKVRKKHEGK